MNRINRIWCTTILFGLTACAFRTFPGIEFQGSPYFEDPPAQVFFSDKEMFNQALSLQYKGQLKPAISFWQKFLVENSKSFEALNNLGMAYYSNDELDKAIQSFETALELEPGNERIKKNLRRTLRFRITLHKENREYPPTIKDLEKISSLSSEDQKEKILREIEDLQEKIFAEVERINTVAEYQNFLATYPTGFYADKTREKLKELTPQTVEIAPGKPKEFLPAFTPESPPAQAPRRKAVIPPALAYLFDGEAESSTEPETQEPAPPMAMESAMPKQLPLGATEVMNKEPIIKEPAGGGAALEEPSIPEAQSESTPQPKVRKVRVITKSAVLNIRARPSIKARIIGKLKKGANVRLIDEIAKWYRVVYATGKDGWISKRFSKEIE